MNGLTVTELAALVCRSEATTLSILRELKRDGLAIDKHDRWQLTAKAELRHGRHLREVDQ